MNEQLDLFDDQPTFDDEASKQALAGRPAALPFSGSASKKEQQLQARQLRAELQARSGLAVALVITDNTSTMMSVRHLHGGIQARVRLHRMFLTAPAEVRKALAHWVKHPRTRKYGIVFKAFIATRRHEIRKKASREVVPVVRGSHYNLTEIFRELNQKYFDNAVDAVISWGRDSGRKTQSIRFGAYYSDERLIRIHPRLDQAFVPPFVVRYIVFHEMLHAHIGIQETVNGRRSIHPRIFKKQETAFPEYEQAVAWIENNDNLRRILRRAKR